MLLMLRFTKRRMTPIEALLQSLEAMLGELEPYLLSPELFWPLSSHSRLSPRDRLTLGNLLLCFDQLSSLRDFRDVHSETRLRKFEIQWQQSQEKWKSAISSKATRELGSRMSLWRAYLVDMEEGRGKSYDYHQEVRNRVIMERLFDLEVDRSNWQKELHAVDHLLRALVVPAEFIWDKRLQSPYPPHTYWFLYRLPRNKD